MKLLLIIAILQVFLSIALYFMIVQERTKTNEDITDTKVYFIKELIKYAEEAKTKQKKTGHIDR